MAKKSNKSNNKSTKSKQISNITSGNIKKSELKRQFLILYYPQNENISQEDVIILQNELKRNVKTKKDELRIDLVLHSSGGDMYSAFKIIKTIRDYCKELNVIIPIMAMSAASLISLGADKIFLSSQSQIGPLDLPTEHPTKEGTRVSSIDCVQSVAYIESIMKSVALNRLSELKSGLGLGTSISIKIAYDIALNFVKPLIEKLDPIQTSQSSRDLQIAKIYGKELLLEYMFKDETQSDKKAEDVISKLVYDYPAHSFAICYNEAKSLGLNVGKSDNYDNWGRVWILIERIRKLDKKILWYFTAGQFKKWTR